MPLSILLIVAVAENGVIGRGNALPWRLKSDLKNFRALTMGKPVIMGRKTFLSIGRPLPGRTSIVVSRDRTFAAPGIVAAPNLPAAFAAARGDALRRGTDCIVVAGGAEIYAQALPLASHIVMTRVHRRVDGDVVFPPIDAKIWREIARDEHAAAAGDDAAYTVISYERGAANAPAGETAS